MNELSSLSVTQLKRAIALKEQIASLEVELNSLTKASTTTFSAAAPQKKVMSAAARAKIAAAVRARWAKQKAAVTTPKAPVDKAPVAKAPVAKPAAPQAKKTMSPAARAKLAEIARKRWAKVRASGKTKL